MKHLSTGIFIYKDLISKLSINLFFIFVVLNLLMRSSEILRCEELIVPKRDVKGFAKAFVNL